MTKLPDFEQMVDDMRLWLKRHGRDPQAGLMLYDFLDGNCSHDFETEGACELCGSESSA